MKKFYFIFLLFLSYYSQAQEIMTVGKEKISIAEFLKIYQKNNNSKQSYSKQDLTEYIDLFTLFKMKLQEAQFMRLDTQAVIKEDYSRYTDQLVQNMMLDKNYVDNILRAQYEHMKQDVKIAHIMVKCAQNATPQDSAIAFNKIKFISDKANPKNFGDIAREHSEDKSSSPQGGSVGYITAFMTFPDFETPCYTTAAGEITPIFRTQFGYHILHIIEKRTARGRIQVAHIFLPKKDSASDDKKMKEAYAELNSKKINFDEAVKKYSQDASTVAKNGELPEFGVSEMVQEFEDQCFNLKNPGDYSKPFKSDYGWHMVKLIAKKSLESYELTKDIIKQKMDKDPRLTDLKQVAYQQMSKKYNLQETSTNLIAYTTPFVDTFFMTKNWMLKADKAAAQKVLFTYNNQSFNLAQFIDFSNKNFNTASSRNKQDVFNAMYAAYKEKQIWDIAKAKLKLENEDYRNLESEYMNGLLIFDIMEKQVWKKAVLDSNGAKKLYETVKNDYWYKERYVIEALKTKSEDKAKTQLNAIATEAPKKLLDKLKKTKDSMEFVYAEKTVEKGDYPTVDEAVSKAAKSFILIDDDKSILVAKVVKTLLPSMKPYNEIKGRIQNLYQTQLEKEWNAGLRAKYPVNINQAELNKLIKN
jgi:peptidyl-prolyl cis-trans isomerase SurA